MMRKTIAAAALLATAILVACGGDGDGAACPDVDASEGAESGSLIVLTHDSFDAKEDVIAAFEQEHGVTVTLIQGGDANEVVNRAILNTGNPEADVLFGIDNLSFERAADAEIFCTFDAERRESIPQAIRDQFGDSLAVTPIDYGYVDLNFDREQGTPPATFDDLTTEAWRGALVVQDPATSSPGLQFLASTVAYFGEGQWQQFWRDLRANDVLVTDGWSAAYYTHFSRWGGDRSLVVSYTTSPAAEVFFAEQPLDEPPTLNVIPGPLFRQVEAAGVLRGTARPATARAFIDFMLSDAFQVQIPETMFVYPVISGLETPDWWRWAEVTVEPAVLDISEADIERWVSEWTEIMRR